MESEDRFAHAQQKLILSRALAYEHMKGRGGGKMYIGAGVIVLIIVLIILF